MLNLAQYTVSLAAIAFILYQRNTSLIGFKDPRIVHNLSSCHINNSLYSTIASAQFFLLLCRDVDAFPPVVPLSASSSKRALISSTGTTYFSKPKW